MRRLSTALGISCLLALAGAARAEFGDGQPAVGVLGATDLVTRPAPATSAARFAGPNGVAVDPASGKVFVADRANHRVLRWDAQAALANGAAAEAVFGQPDLTSGAAGIGPDRLDRPIGVHVDALGGLWVADYGNHRVLRFDGAAERPSGTAADGVLGQPDFVSEAPATSAVGMRGPVAVVTDAAGRLWVADYENNRVLRFDDAAQLAPGAAAAGVLGQPDFASAAAMLSQAGLNGPNGVAAGAEGELWVSEYGNCRVLRFDAAAGKPDGGPADGVLGKPDFVTGGAQLSRTGFGPLRHVAVGDNRLYVVEQENNRVLVFDGAPDLPDGAPASFVLGQPDFESAAAPVPPTAASLATPRAVAVDLAGEWLWVADWANNRVVRYGFDGTVGPPPGPVIVVLGSSTAAGVGPSSPDSTWVGRYRATVQGSDPAATVVNLAVSGYTTYHVLPTGSTPPPDRPAPDADRNISRALELDPDAIIVNLPTNDIALGYGVAEPLANYAVVAALAAADSVPIWFTTAQPRNFGDPALRQQLQDLTDATLASYGDRAIDFWTGLAAADGTIRLEYDAGDGIHLNDAGHRLLHDRVLAAGVWQTITAVAPDDAAWPGVLCLDAVLHPLAPNPFNPAASVAFDLARGGRVALTVFDARGRQVRRLGSGEFAAGRHVARWDGRDEAGRAVAAGSYLVRLVGPTGQAQTVRGTLVR